MYGGCLLCPLYPLLFSLPTKQFDRLLKEIIVLVHPKLCCCMIFILLSSDWLRKTIKLVFANQGSNRLPATFNSRSHNALQHHWDVLFSCFCRNRFHEKWQRSIMNFHWQQKVDKYNIWTGLRWSILRGDWGCRNYIWLDALRSWCRYSSMSIYSWIASLL